MSGKGKRGRDIIEPAIEENDGSPRTTKMRSSISKFYSSRPDFLPTSISFFYFIGRLNPPHNGHIAALHSLITILPFRKFYSINITWKWSSTKTM